MSLVLTILLLGLLAGLSPATIVVFILVLATARAKVNAAAFLIGWSVSLVIVFSVSYEIGGTHSSQHGGGRTASTSSRSCSVSRSSSQLLDSGGTEPGPKPAQG